MADLIDRAALLERLANIKDSTNWDEQSRGVIRGFEIFINKAPTVDAVEVCRCKNCEWGGKCEVESLLREVDKIPDPYCAAGKRREIDD